MPLKTSAGTYWCNHCEDNAFSETCWRCHRGHCCQRPGPVVRHRPVRHPARRMVPADARRHQHMKRATLLALGFIMASPARTTMASPARTPISDRLAIRAIIGEGANQSDAALAAIASAIHNRGTLRGVYGLTNPVGDHASDALCARATRAWTLAKTGADAAAGCKFFGCPTDVPWFHKHGFTAVKTIGDITFYKP